MPEIRPQDPGSDGSRELVVLHAIRPPGPDTTFATQMQLSRPPGVRVEFFDWRKALSTDYDVLHVHWPEFLIRGASKRDALLNLVRFPLLMARLKRRRVAVVRTLHNLTPHESGHPLEARYTRALDSRVVTYIALNPVTDVTGKTAEVILHGDYIERFGQHPRSGRDGGRILYFGLVRPYKGIDVLIEAFEGLEDPHATLRIVGRPNSDGMRKLVADAEGRNPTISSNLRFVSDAELVSEVTAAALVVLPYREMHNSGSLLVALSLGRPVLTRDTPVNRSISAEIGPGWIYFYTGELTADVLREALREASNAEADRVPDFVGRDWATVGVRHAAVYRRAASIAKDR